MLKKKKKRNTIYSIIYLYILHKAPSRTLNARPSHIRRQRTGQKQHHFRSFVRSPGSCQGDIRYFAPFLCLERNPRTNGLSSQLEYFRFSRRLGNAGIDPTICHGIRANVVSIEDDA